MKITDHEVIQSGEQELIDTITADLDWSVVEAVFRKEHKLNIEDNVEYKKGDIVIHNNQIAYKLEFDVQVVISVLLDRKGNYISASTSADSDELTDDDDNTTLDATQKQAEKTENSYEAALSEFASVAAPEPDDADTSLSNAGDPEDKIFEITSRSEEIIAEIGGENSSSSPP
ncbi:MAG: hypothetical protein KKH68_02305 [Proteobacteria bacterium]|nr:hypothetical protein [Pseudomonadota bacterium]